MNSPKPGDVVKLKSGGPPMTVAALVDSDACYCVWFVNNIEAKGHNFAFVALTILPKPTE